MKAFLNLLGYIIAILAAAAFLFWAGYTIKF